MRTERSIQAQKPLVWRETASSKIWTRVTDSISYNDNLVIDQ